MNFPPAVLRKEEEYEQFLLELDYLESLEWAYEQFSRCRKYWIYVIRKAVHDFVMTKNAKHVSGKRLHQEAKKWLFAEAPTHENSFLFICEQYKIDPERWRKEALNTSPGHMRRIELLGRRNSRAGLYD